MKALLPGSYDPVTKGHVDIIERAAAEFDEVYAVVFVNPDKRCMFSTVDRAEMLSIATSHIPNVIVDYSFGYVVDYMKEKGLDKIVKGYRNDADLKYEEAQAEYNFSHGGYLTDLYSCSDEYDFVSSTLVRKMINSGENIEEIVPKEVAEYIEYKKSNF